MVVVVVPAAAAGLVTVASISLVSLPSVFSDKSLIALPVPMALMSAINEVTATVAKPIMFVIIWLLSPGRKIQISVIADIVRQIMILVATTI